MGNDFSPEQIDNANNVGEIIAVVRKEIGCLKVRSLEGRRASARY